MDEIGMRLIDDRDDEPDDRRPQQRVVRVPFGERDETDFGSKPGPDDAARVIRLDQGTITQDGVARVFAERFAGQLRYCWHTAAWFHWGSTHWRRDQQDAAFQYARRLGREQIAGKADRDLREVGKVAFAAGVERFARGDEALAVTSECWDPDPWLLGTPGGTVDLRTGKLRHAVPSEGITKLAAVAPAEEALCPTWLRFLDEVTRQNAAYIRFLRQWCGYCLTGDTREQALCFAFGPGGNGKGVMIRVVSGIMGSYAVAAAMETFTASKYDRHPTEIASLRGARLVTASETEQGNRWAESRIKQLTGGDTMRARYMRQDEFQFTPVLKLLIIGNDKPSLSSVDDAARRRFNLLPFLFRPETPDPQLEEKLREEWPGILRWMIDGCIDWQRHGLVRPDVVQTATEGYFAEQDVPGMWLDERCHVAVGNPHRQTTTAELFADWTDFARAHNEPTGSMRSFAQRLDNRGFAPAKNVPSLTGGRSRGFRGIELRREPARGSAASHLEGDHHGTE